MAIKLLIVTLSFAIFNWIGWPVELRFEYAPLNYFIFTVFCLCGLFLPFLISYQCKNMYLKWMGIGLSIVIAVPFFGIGVLANIEGVDAIRKGYDSSYRYLKEVQADGHFFRLYRTNCGATCPFSLELREEWDSGIGIKLVKTVWNEHNAVNAELITIGSEVQVISSGDLLFQSVQ